MAQTTKNNIEKFQDEILKWFFRQGRSFPWRERGLSAYQLIIAEILLQRTKAETVNNFYNAFILKYYNWQQIDNESLEAIEEYLKPVGLYKQRAGRLKKLAEEMVARNSEIPILRSELEDIPFMGQYIANAVELLIFNRRVPLIDVNMSRVLERYFNKRKLSDIRYDPYLQNLAFQIVDHPLSKELNWAILDFASLVCKARSPLCMNCILAPNCSYYALVR